jgi:hypothetical protein
MSGWLCSPLRFAKVGMARSAVKLFFAGTSTLALCPTIPGAITARMSSIFIACSCNHRQTWRRAHSGAIWMLAGKQLNAPVAKNRRAKQSRKCIVGIVVIIEQL